MAVECLCVCVCVVRTCDKLRVIDLTIVLRLIAIEKREVLTFAWSDGRVEQCLQRSRGMPSGWKSDDTPPVPVCLRPVALPMLVVCSGESEK